MYMSVCVSMSLHQVTFVTLGWYVLFSKEQKEYVYCMCVLKGNLKIKTNVRTTGTVLIDIFKNQLNKYF